MTEAPPAPAAQTSTRPRTPTEEKRRDNRNDRYNYLYKEKELEGWKERIKNVAEKAQTTYVITNNHFESKAGVNALELKVMLGGKRVPAPPTLIQKYPELRRFADPAEEFGEDIGGPQLPLLD